MPPQIRKLYPAPCHSAVSVHTAKRLNIVRSLPFRLPPSGMYT